MNAIVSIAICHLSIWLTGTLGVDASRFETTWQDPRGIAGALVITGRGEVSPATLDAFRRLAGEPGSGPILLITSNPEPREDRWEEIGFDHLRRWSPDQGKGATALEDLARQIEESKAVWLAGSLPDRFIYRIRETEVETALQRLLEAGGVIGGSGVASTFLGDLVGEGGSLENGLGLFPDAVISLAPSDQADESGDRHGLQANLGSLHVELGDNATLIVRGRQLVVLGESGVSLLLPESDSYESERITLEDGTIGDLTAFRRHLRDRARGSFPPAEFPDPVVQNGALVIVGGGRMPAVIWERFVELAGGVEARIVVVPTASGGPIPEDPSRLIDFSLIHEQEPAEIGILRGRTPDEIETDEQIAMLKRATGIWFGGGRQWRFLDAYEGTQVIELFHDVLDRGGVIGGSSAGATIQGDYLVRGNPLGNTDMMALGYERGFAFLPGVAIDQHFSERDRFDDLKRVVNRFPQVLGLGIDEGTALVVQGAIAEIIGRGAAHILDRRGEREESHHSNDFQRVDSGERYQLVEGALLEADPLEVDPLRVALVSGSWEYDSEESLTRLKSDLEQLSGVQCDLIQAIDRGNIPSIKKLREADIALFFTRRLTIDGPQLDEVKRLVESGTPIIGVRTASHGFQNWLEMDSLVFGGSYNGHYSNDLKTSIEWVEEQYDHPILDGFEPFESHGSLYRVSPLKEDCQVLLNGRSPEGLEPIAWWREEGSRRIVYTSLGHQSDFEEAAFRGLLTRSILWAVDRLELADQ